MSYAKGVFISDDEIRAIIYAHDSDCALLWLWQIQSGSTDLNHAASALVMTISQVNNAHEKLNRILHSIPQTSSETTDHLTNKQTLAQPTITQNENNPKNGPDSHVVFPEYTSDEIATLAERDKDFLAVLQEAEQITQKKLSRHEKSELTGIYKMLKLPADVMFLLLHFCADNNCGANGVLRRPSIKDIVKTARLWAESEITTMTQAEAYVAQISKTTGTPNDNLTPLMDIVGIPCDKKLSDKSQKILQSWITAGYTTSQILNAIDKAKQHIGPEINIPYVDAILTKSAQNNYNTNHNRNTFTQNENKTKYYNDNLTPSGELRLSPTEF